MPRAPNGGAQRHARRLRDELGTGIRNRAIEPASSAPHHGAFFLALVWGASLVQLPAMGIAPPVWETPPAEAALDLSYRLVYGLAVAAAYSVLDR